MGSTHVQPILSKPTAIALAVCVFFASTPSRAEDFFWNDEFGGSWDDASNWTTSGGGDYPREGDTAFLTRSYFGIVPVNYRSPGNPALGGLYIDSNNHLFQNAGDDGDLVTAFEIVGWDGRGEPGLGGEPPEGSHIQRGAKTRVENQLILGLESGGRGFYELLGGELETGTTVVGKAGQGNFFQLGSHQVARDLVLGDEAGSSGVYSLSGPLTVGGEVVVGNAGVGTFEQPVASGRLMVGSDLVLGRLGGGSGTYELGGGELQVPERTRINQGEFVQTTASSLHRVGATLAVGAPRFESEGAYRLVDGTLRVGPDFGDSADPGVVVREDLVVLGPTRLIPTPPETGVGTFEQSGGSHFIGNPDHPLSEAWLRIGGRSSYQLSGGELVVYGGTAVSPSGRGGSFVQTGGVHRIGVSRSGQEDGLDAAVGDLRLGTDRISHGAYTMQDGELTISPTVFDTGSPLPGTTARGGRLLVGSAANNGGTGEFVQFKGSVLAHELEVSDGSEYRLVDGSLRLKEVLATGTAGIRAPTGGEAKITGLFTQEGGRHTLRRIFNREGGTYDLQDGSLTVNLSIEPSDNDPPREALLNRGVFEFSGGDLVLRRGTLVGEDFSEIGKGLFRNTLDGRLDVSGAGTRVLDGDLANSGTVLLSNTGLRVTGDYRGLGDVSVDSVLELDPSADFVEGDATIEAGSYFVADAGSSFRMGADFLNGSNRATLWDTDEARLLFDGEDSVVHTFGLAGVDVGASLAGYVDNFAFAHLSLADGEALALVDGNAEPGAALYVGVLDELIALDDITSAFNIYYDARLEGNGWLGSQSFTLDGGGSLVPVPEPGTLPLVGLALAALAFRRRHAGPSC